MAYAALYRKFRPQTFDRVKGQDPIIRTLKNQLQNGQIGHAYLFTGTRGTGKTSVAKILAKAVNCLNPQDGEPCCACENCNAIAHGSFMDVVEIDAASNTGIEDIRRVIEEIQYTPANGKYKVYIIDEVHMLSMNAFNAFLKTLEEPPAYVVFILATTEPHKLPATILSRCQRYDFKRISTQTIAQNLTELLQAEGVEAEEKAVRYVAHAGDGSMRDALSLMDRCVAFRLGEKITYESVLEILGTMDTEDFSALYQAICRQDAIGALQTIERTVASGKDLTPFINDFIRYLRNLLILHVGGGKGTELLGLSEENEKQLALQAKDADPSALMRDIRILSELLNQLRLSAAKQILTEVAVIKLATPQMETDMDSVLQRLRALEERPQAAASAQTVSMPSPQPVMEPAAPEAVYEEPVFTGYPEDAILSGYEDFPQAAEEPFIPQSYADEPASPVTTAANEAASAAETSAAGGDAALVCSRFAEILDACEDRRLKTFLAKTKTAAGPDGSLQLIANGEIAYKQMKEDDVQEYLHELIRRIVGFDLPISVVKQSDQPEIPEQQNLGDFFKDINISIGTEDV